MVSIDNTKCTGCESCVDACPQQAIAMQNNLAIINNDLCCQCGICVEMCPASAIREIVLTSIKLAKGGERMMHGYGRGFGFRGASPSWPYVGRGRGGLPRCWHLGLLEAGRYSRSAPYWPTPARGEELGYLKNQADVMRS